MACLLALLLFLILCHVPLEANVTLSGQQNALHCHVCEKDNAFDCTNPVQCEQKERNCVTAAMYIFPRVLRVSKQCSVYCGNTVYPALDPSGFLLERPLPFAYLSCCSINQCNSGGPNQTVMEAMLKVVQDPLQKQARSATEQWAGRAGSVTHLMLASAILGPRLL